MAAQRCDGGRHNVARIRTIKPEFPQSETMGKVSRDARLLFIQLWTLADDSGRARAASRMLASLLYPYDDDARGLIDGWLSELEGVGAIRRYESEGESYLEICKWLTHQKIDRPSASKFPPPPHILASPREPSRNVALDQGSRIKDQGRDQGPRNARASPRDVPRGTFAKIRETYPAGTYRDADWLLAERECHRRVDDGVPPADLVAAAAAYALQQQAKGAVGSQFVLAPSRFFGPSGEWRGPFPLPAAVAPPQRESEFDRVMRLNGSPAHQPEPHRVIDHDDDRPRLSALA
jgi:hypothetical protein